MKYLKTYESTITLDLDEYDQEKLMEYALDNDKVNIVKGLLDNKFDPNHLIDREPMIVYNNGRVDLRIIELLIKYGADVNLVANDNPIIITTIFNYHKKLNTNDFIDRLRLLIKSGANLFATSEYGYNFFDEIDDKFENSRITIKTIKAILNMIKEESPEQYKEYEARKEAIKYNL